MDIMTREEFETLSKKIFSKRNGTILEIDNALDAYHDAKKKKVWPDGDELNAVMKLRDVVHKFDKEKEEKYLSRFWHIRKQQSSKRRIAVEALRKQIYGRMWELYNPKRPDIEVFEDGSVVVESRATKLTKALEARRVIIKPTGDTANTLRSTLHGKVETWLKAEGKAHWEAAHKKHKEMKVESTPEKEMRNAWFYYYDGSGNPSSIIRLATVDMLDLLYDECVYLRYADSSGWHQDEKYALGKMAAPSDAQVGTKASKHPPVEKFPEELRDELEAYLKELLGTEMADEVALVNEALQGEKDFYTAVVHIDYYAFRSLKNIGLHKDTVGNTLFVALHYMNDEAMMGPEYVDDPAPIRPAGGNGFYADNVYLRNVGDVVRHGAPWAKVRQVMGETKYVWPKDLVTALQGARTGPKDADYIQKYEDLPPNGLITFVDELVFHATPSELLREKLVSSDDAAKRTEKRRYVSSGVSVPGVTAANGAVGNESPKLNVFGERTYQSRIARRLSVAINNEEDLPPATSGDDGIRRFWRVWLSIVPKHWYEAIDLE